MKLSIETKALQSGLAIAGRVISAKAPWPILSNIKIAAQKDKITLSGCNGDTTFEADVAATVTTPGATLLPFDHLVKFIAAAKGTTVEIEASGSGYVVKSGRGRIVLAPSNLEDYPAYRPPEGQAGTLDATTLNAALKFCVAAADDSEARYYLQGVYVAERNGGLEFWGTDGHALHHTEIAEADPIGGGGILPTDAVGIVTNIADRHDTVQLLVCERGWHIITPSVRAFGKVIDGSYPDCRRVLAGFTDWREVIAGPKDELIAALSVAACGTDEGAGGTRQLVIRGKTDNPVIAFGRGARGGVMSTGRAEMDVRAKADFAGCVNSKLMQAAITGIGASDVTIQHCGAAWKVEPSQKSTTSETYAIVMSIRASDEEMADAA
ncbi:MAG: DNA polymerase III subunit beta [Fuscovulum sp.]|nr:MAG: DNA polymerase III subunit beta [Fuscovulum sp.]